MADGWRLVGECTLAFVWRARPTGVAAGALALPRGVQRLPGLPVVIVAARYQESPVGPYTEVAVGVPARLGLRPGLCVVHQVVSVADARVTYRRDWGLPAELGTVTWPEAGTVRWEEGGVVVRAARSRRWAALRVPVPVAMVMRSIQRRPPDGLVVAPRRVLGLLSLARVTVTAASGEEGVPAAGPWPALAGRHRGFVLSGARILALPARTPAGLWSSLRAPAPTGGRRLAEPALAVRRRR